MPRPQLPLVHAGLILQIARAPHTLSAMQVSAPKPLPSLKALRDASGKYGNDIFVETVTPWTCFASPGDPTAPSLPQLSGGAALACWSGAMEDNILTRAGVTCKKEIAASKGRCGPARLALRPLTPMSRDPQGGTIGKYSRVWAAISSRLKELIGLRSKVPSPNRRRHQSLLAKALWGLGQSLLEFRGGPPQAKAVWLGWWAAWLTDPWTSEGCALGILNAAFVEAQFQMHRTFVRSIRS